MVSFLQEMSDFDVTKTARKHILNLNVLKLETKKCIALDYKLLLFYRLDN